MLHRKHEEPATAMMRDEYHDEDEAFGLILEAPLSVDVIHEYRILLSTGGPAVRIIGELDRDWIPYTVRLQCQDWFTEWTDVEAAEHGAALLYFAQQFGEALEDVAGRPA
jgi:hypothetical protein